MNGFSVTDLCLCGDFYYLLGLKLRSGDFVVLRASEYNFFLDHLGVFAARDLFVKEFNNLIVCVVCDSSRIGKSFFGVLKEK